VIPALKYAVGEARALADTLEGLAAERCPDCDGTGLTELGRRHRDHGPRWRCSWLCGEEIDGCGAGAWDCAACGGTGERSSVDA
jgi:hypothetical protein